MKWHRVATVRGTTFWAATRNYQRIYTTTPDNSEPGEGATIYTSLRDVHSTIKPEVGAPISPEKAAEKLEMIIASSDCESGHLYADDFLLDLLESLGYDLKVIFKCGTFYYS